VKNLTEYVYKNVIDISNEQENFINSVLSVMTWSQRSSGNLSDHKCLSTCSGYQSNGYIVPIGYICLPWQSAM
jgi:hypothetical protein